VGSCEEDGGQCEMAMENLNAVSLKRQKTGSSSCISNRQNRKSKTKTSGTKSSPEIIYTPFDFYHLLNLVIILRFSF